MYLKRFAAALLAVMLLLGCSLVPAAAVDTPVSNSIISRSTGQLNHRLPANIITPITQALPFSAGDTFTFDCTYTPKSASVDFGYLDSDKVFHYVNRTSGNISESFEFSTTGRYTLAIRNNESYAVTVTGTVKY